VRNLTNAFIEKTTLASNKPVHLYTIEDYDGASNDLHYTSHEANITFDGVLYTAFGISHSSVDENSAGEVDTVTLTLSNASRLIQAYLELYDWRKKKVIIKQIWLDDLSTPTNVKEDSYYVDSYSASYESVSFILSTLFNLSGVQIPSRRYERNSCSWRFKGAECGYAGAETTCNKTLARCTVLANDSRYGGFPSIPGRLSVSV
jgi:lambda family phage minor tail protein L